MLLANSDLISHHPAQLYYSVLPFLPSNTYLARYPTPRGCISVLTGRENSWPPSLFTLPLDLCSEDTAVTFAPDGHMFAVGFPFGIAIYASNGLLNSVIETSSSYYDCPYLAAFTEDECGVVAVSNRIGGWQIERFDLVKQNSQIYLIDNDNDDERRDWDDDDDGYSYGNLLLSEYGSYAAHAILKNRETRIRIRKTDGSDDISIPLGCTGQVLDLDLAGELAHLVAVATEHITILSIPSGGVQRILYHKAKYVCISHDGSFLAAGTWARKNEVRLWSITQGTLLATFQGYSPVFSRTNHLYYRAQFGGGRVYDASADLNNVTIQSFSLPSHTFFILPTPDESRILFKTEHDIQVWPMRQFTNTRRYLDAVRDMCLSDDAS